jgi:predicted DNA-binding antitoxin AbrB/MazE fold protein
MSLFIEAIYEGGVLRPLVSYELKEHKRYRLMLMEEVATSELSPNNRLEEMIINHITLLEDGRLLVRLPGIFAYSGVDLGFDDIQIALRECYQEQEEEWNQHQ